MFCLHCGVVVVWFPPKTAKTQTQNDYELGGIIHFSKNKVTVRSLSNDTTPSHDWNDIYVLVGQADTKWFVYTVNDKYTAHKHPKINQFLESLPIDTTSTCLNNLNLPNISIIACKATNIVAYSNLQSILQLIGSNDFQLKSPNETQKSQIVTEICLFLKCITDILLSIYNSGGSGDDVIILSIQELSNTINQLTIYLSNAGVSNAKEFIQQLLVKTELLLLRPRDVEKNDSETKNHNTSGIRMRVYKSNVIDTIMVHILWCFGKCVSITEDCYDIIVDQKLTRFKYQNNQDIITLRDELRQSSDKLNYCTQLLQCLRKKININTSNACDYNPVSIIKGSNKFNFEQYNSTQVCKYFRKLCGKYNYLTQIDLAEFNYHRKTDSSQQTLRFRDFAECILTHFYNLLEILINDMKLTINNTKAMATHTMNSKYKPKCELMSLQNGGENFADYFDFCLFDVCAPMYPSKAQGTMYYFNTFFVTPCVTSNKNTKKIKKGRKFEIHAKDRTFIGICVPSKIFLSFLVDNGVSLINSNILNKLNIKLNENVQRNLIMSFFDRKLSKAEWYVWCYMYNVIFDEFIEKVLRVLNPFVGWNGYICDIILDYANNGIRKFNNGLLQFTHIPKRDGFYYHSKTKHAITQFKNDINFLHYLGMTVSDLHTQKLWFDSLFLTSSLQTQQQHQQQQQQEKTKFKFDTFGEQLVELDEYGEFTSFDIIVSMWNVCFKSLSCLFWRNKHAYSYLYYVLNDDCLNESDVIIYSDMKLLKKEFFFIWWFNWAFSILQKWVPPIDSQKTTKYNCLLKDDSLSDWKPSRANFFDDIFYQLRKFLDYDDSICKMFLSCDIGLKCYTFLLKNATRNKKRQNIHSFCYYNDTIHIKYDGTYRTVKVKDTLLLRIIRNVKVQNMNQLMVNTIEKQLLVNNNYLYKQNTYGQTALSAAYSVRFVKMIGLILKHGGDVNDKVSREKNIPLLFDCIIKLDKYWQDKDSENNDYKDLIEILQILLKYKPKIAFNKNKCIWQYTKHFKNVKDGKSKCNSKFVEVELVQSDKMLNLQNCHQKYFNLLQKLCQIINDSQFPIKKAR